MAISDRLNKLTTDITNAYTSIENKGGTIPANKNTNNLPTAIDSIQSSNIIGATAEGESLNLVNTKAMPYSDYVVEGKSEQDGTPSPSNPSEIYSVADDVNLFDYSKITNFSGDIVNGTLLESYSNGVKVQGNVGTTPGTGLYENGWFKPGNHYDNRFSRISVEAGTDIYISVDVTLLNQYNNNSNKMYIYLYGTENITAYEHSLSLNNKIRISQKFTVTQTGTYYPVFTLNSNTVLIENIKISTSSNTEYSPYNQGTVTTKQRGKNEFDTSNIISNVTDYTITVQDGGFIIRTGGMSNGTYFGLLKDLCPNLKVGDKFKFTWDSNATRGGQNVMYVYLQGYNQTIYKDTLYTCTQTMLDSSVAFYGQQGEYYKDIIFYLDGQTSDYEPYQTPHDYTIQTEPLRSLPNGVKDTIEADGIHRRVGVKVFDGSENNWNIETTANYTRFYIKIDDAVINTTERQIIMSNYFKYVTGNLVGTAFIYNQYLFIYPNTDILTIEKLKTWLSTHNAEFIYELKEEIIEPLTQNQATTMLDIIKTGSYEGTTNIYTDEDVKPTMKVEYYKKG